MATPMHEVFDQFKQQLPDIDPTETQEWMDSLDAIVDQAGPDRARFIIYKLLKRARQLQVGLPPLVQTRYINTISPEQEPYFPGDETMELRVRRMIRWNALAMVVKANKLGTGRVIVPVTIIGDQDGLWDKNAWKTDAFHSRRHATHSFSTTRSAVGVAISRPGCGR